MATSVVLPLGYESLAKGLEDELSENEKAEFLKALSSRLAVQEDAKGLNLNETLKVVHKHGYFDNGKSASRLLSNVAKKTSVSQKIENIIQKHSSSFPEGKADFVGREKDVKEVTERLKNKIIPGINLFGESGVGKTTLAKEVSKEFKGFETLTIDLRDIKDMDTVYFQILLKCGVKSWNFSVDKIYEYLNEKLDKKTLVIFDNVEQLLNKKEASRKHFTGLLKSVIETKACKSKLLKFILTSQEEINEPSLKGKYFTEYEVKPLDNEVSKKFIMKRRNDVLNVQEEENDQVLNEISNMCRDIPYLLKVAEQLMRFSASIQAKDVLQKLNTLIEQKVPRDFACISALFDSLPSDHLKEVAVKISLLRRPFSWSTAMKISEIKSDHDAEIDLEMLVNYKMIAVVDEDGKSKYDTHGLFKDFIKYICGSRPEINNSFKQGEKQFFKHFSEKMVTYAKNLETEFVETYSKLEINRANLELAIDLSEENKETLDLLLHTDDHKQFALMGILFEVLKDVDERRDLFAKWADMAAKQENWLASALMRCWQSLQCTDTEGRKLAPKTLEEAHECIKKAEETPGHERKISEVKSLYLHCSGKIKYYSATKLARESNESTRLLKEGIEDLKDAILMRETFMGDSTLSSRGLNLIGNCYMDLNDPLAALEYYQRAIEMKRRLVGSDRHWEFPTFYNQIAQVHDQIGRKYEQGFLSSLLGRKKKAIEKYEKAEELTKKALELQEELDVSGTEHTAIFQRNLANILLGLKKYDDALECAQKSYEIRKKISGKHPDTVRILYAIGIIHEWRRDPKAAIQIYEEAIEMEESLPEDNHSVVRRLLYGRLEVMLKRVKVKKGKQPENVRILYLTGISQEFQENTKAALKSYEEALKLEECLPEDDHSVVRKKLYGRLAEMYKKTNQEDKLRDMEIKIKEIDKEEESWIVSGPVEFEINVFENGGYYNHSKYGHFIYVPPNTVTEPTKIKCKVFDTHPILPPAKFTEGLASYIVELGPTSVDLRNPIIVTLLHSGPVKKYGYEITVRSFDTANESWIEIEVLKEDSHAPEYCTPHYLQVSLKKLSTLAVVTRLIDDSFQITPQGCVVRSSAYDDVTVEFPEGAVNKTLEGTMNVLPDKRMVLEDNIVASPALLFHGFQGVVFSKNVKIKIPFASSITPGSHPLLLRLDFDSQSNGQWNEVANFNINDDFIEFSVNHFSAFWPINTLHAPLQYVKDSVNSCYRCWFDPPSEVSFAAYKKNGQTWPDVEFKLTCVALDGQDALNDKMAGDSFTCLVYSTGDQPMRCQEKAYPEVEGLSDWDKDFFLRFLGENKECNKQLCGTAVNDAIKLRYYKDPNEKQLENRLCLLTLKRQGRNLGDNIGDSSGFIEYFGISSEVLKESPEDIAGKMKTHLKVEISLGEWNAIKFYSSLPRKDDCFKDLVNCLNSFEGAKHISHYLQEGHDLVTSPLRGLEQEVQDKIIDIVASNIGYYGSKLANYLDVSKECSQNYSGAEQVSQMLRKWMTSSNDGTVEKLFEALRYLKKRKAEAELANYTTKLSIEKASSPSVEDP